MNARTWILAFAALGYACAAHAREALIEEIVVRGELRESPLDSVPGSVSVISARDVERRQAQHIEQLLALAPNVNFASGASRGRYLQIRGIGELGQFIEPLNASVGLIVDRVDFSGVGGATTLYDVDQVEIFRGPQGTLYGANALAGLVNIVTAQPTDTPEGRVDLEAGTYDSMTLGALASGPLAATLAGRLAVQQYRSDGWVENDHLGRDDTSDFDELTARGKLRWVPMSGTTVDLMAGYVDVDNGYDAFSLDNVRDTLSDEPGRDAQESRFASLTATFEGPDGFDVEAVLAHADSDIAYGYDEDWTYDGFDPSGYSSTDLYLRDRTTSTGEVRFVSADGGRIWHDSTDWVLGVYALAQEEELDRRYTFLAQDFRSRFEIDRLALFGQTDTAVTATTTLTVGWRFEQHQASYTDVEGVDFDPSDDLWGGRISLDRLIGADTLVYASVSRGYKAGGFNTDGSLPADLREFDPETLYNLEAGLKASWQDDRLTTRVALFHMWRDDMQVGTSLVEVRPDGSSEFIEFTGNAAEGTNYGVEAELTWRANERWQWFGGIGLLETEYRDFVSVTGERLDGREQAHAPEYQYVGGVEFTAGRGWFARAEVEGKDAFYFSDSHDARSDAFTLLMLSAGIDQPGWGATIWMRNVTDENYAVRGYYFGNDPRLDYAPRTYTQLGEPRVAGVSLRWEF